MINYDVTKYIHISIPFDTGVGDYLLTLIN